MKITELLSKETIILNLKSKNKEAVLNELAEKLNSAGKLVDKDRYLKEIKKREEQSSTGIGDGIAIPHAKTSAVKTPALAFGYSKEGLDFDTLDGQPAHIFFMIAASEGANNEHLETLSRLSVLLMNQEFRNKLENAKTEAELLRIIDEQEQSEEGEEMGNNNQEKDLVLAVTACPTGIAHTYMAADALKAAGKELGVDIKVETNGSTGVKNRLTDDEIRRAKGIIVAADKAVEMARFNGKKVIIVPVVQGIKKSKELVERARKGDAPVYHGGEDRNSSSSDEGQKGGLGLYKHLMSGVSNMLPFVVGGGILIAFSFMFGIKAYDPSDPSFNQFAKLLMDIGGGNAFSLMVPVLAGFIGMSIADRPGFAPGMVGGLIAANGGSGFLGGLIAGFLGGYSVLLIKKLCKALPESLEGIKPVLIYPLLGIFITGAVMLLAINPPVKALNTGMQAWLQGMGSANRVLLGIILGGMMAVDMGGPVNKAAFTFGIAMIAAGNYGPHSAVMAGGMVPPLGIAIATFLFRNKFTKQEKDAGKTNIVMGLSFITEGAIPFAAADPSRVLPSCIIGSAVAGALSMLFNIELRAPHGGFFVIPITNSPLLYTAAIAIGSVVTAVLLGVLKKPVNE
jgi:PTS system fructose-specific IIC component